MRLAVLSDVHARLEPLRRALTGARELGCDGVVCAGDVLDDGPEPVECLELLRAEGIPCVRGNHERWALDRGGSLHSGAVTPLPPALDAWVRSWPKSLELASGSVRIDIHHGSTRDDMDCLWPDAPATVLEAHLARARADILVVGHTHEPFVRPVSGARLVVNAGTLGAPYPGQRSTFAVVEVERREARIDEL